jgi:alkylhydroperoxidase family enzyme
LQGEKYSQTAAALRDGNLDAADVTPAQRLLLQFVETLTRHAYRITDEQVEGLREAGWTDRQIAEAVYDGALFNLFVRLADAFDIHPDPSYDSAGVPRAVTASDAPEPRAGGGP